MRINQLTVAGFGPYLEPQTVDFDAFADDGIFLISGKTGAGKSSILDAISFALYDSVARYDGTKQKLRSDHCKPEDPTLVTLEFTVNGERYRVTRSPEYERPKKGREGFTTQTPTAELFVSRDGAWHGIAAKPRDVGHELSGILGLNKDQFLQVILLAQNRFQQFLLAKNDERQSVLRTLFGTRRFLDYEDAVVERRKSLEAELASGRAATGQLLEQAAQLTGLTVPDAGVTGWLEAAVAEMSAELAAEIRVAAAADAAFTSADAAHTALLDLQRRQQRRADARAKQVTLDEAGPAIAEARVESEEAVRANTVWPYIEARASASEAVESATTAEAIARAQVAAFEDAALPERETLAGLEKRIDELGRALGALDEVVARERELPALGQAVADAESDVASLERQRTETATLAAGYPAQLDALTAELSTSKVTAAGELEASAELARLNDALAAAKEATRLESALVEARAIEAAKAADDAAATQRFSALLAARLNGHAAELASELVDGEPCAVCGSTTHPSPATGDSEPVTEADVDAAREALDVHRAAMDAARDVASEVNAQLAAQRAKAGGRDAAGIEAERVPATAALDAARTAAARATEVEALQEKLRAEQDAAAAALESLRVRKDAATSALIEAQAARDAIAVQAQQHRGDFSSVTDHVDALTQHRGAATKLAESIRRVERSTEALAQADAALAAQLVEHEFDSENDAAAARLTKAELAALGARIRSHDDERASVMAILAEDELQHLPAEAPDIAGSTVALAALRDERDAALQRRSALTERHAQLERIVQAATTRLAASAELNERFEQVLVLANTLQGKDPNTRRMKLESYVLAAELEEIVVAANARLRTMSGGRYLLEHDDGLQFRAAKSGLGLAIFDQHTGQSRATHSLSGGETFLASLALALGLAEVVTGRAGGITLDTLFIDEGFGSLDADTLEIAMSTLDSLRTGGRTVGLISHVEGMKEQIPAKLRISVSDQGWSEISQDVA